MGSPSGSEQDSTTCADSERDSLETSDREEGLPNSPQSNQAQLDIPAPPGLLPPPGTPSHGSIKHGMGECRPCSWFWKPQGCQNGAECNHCHACPIDELKTRKRAKLAMLRLGLATPKSNGAKAHGSGECRPCAWFWRPQ